MTHDNTAEPTVKRAAFPMAIMRGGSPLFHAPGTFPPEYRRDAQLEALWQAGQPQPQPTMHWVKSYRADPRALPLANRHYNRQSHDSPQFVPPGSCLVLLSERADALWVTSAPLAAYVKHAWAGAWVCSLFRNEGAVLSSALIKSAVAATRWYYGDPPALGFITFVDADKTRKKRDPGRCYRKAGWSHVGFTAGGLYAFQLLPSEMPAPLAPIGAQTRLFEFERAA